jgi:hypothetical protein
MPNISAPDFSFIRFDDTGLCLAAFGNHDEAFHFKVDVDRLLSEPIRLGRANMAGVVIHDYSPEVRAIWTTARCVLSISGVTEASSFYLYSIAIGEDEVIYEVTTNLAGLRDRLYADFGLVMNGSAIITACILDLQVKAKASLETLLFLSSTITYFWNEGYIAAPGDAISAGPQTMFRFALLHTDGTVLAVTNPFKVLHEEGYTSRISYSCNEAAFGFSYVPGTPNIVRLPIWLLKPVYPKRQTVHQKSDGKKILLSSFVEKEYVLETELAPEWFHERVAIAMAHDTFLIKNQKVGELEVMDNDVYQPQWPDDVNAQVVPGRSKVKVARYGFFNSNCGANDCCAPILSIGEITTTSVLLGLVYSRSTTQIRLRYRQEEETEWTELIIPASSSYLLSDLEPGEGFVIAAVSICNGDEGDSSRSLAFSTLSDPDECEEVSIPGAPVLPDGEVGVPYNFSLSLSGSPIFTLFNIVKPSWMTITVGGLFDYNTVRFTGTPDESGSFSVSFDVANCAGSGTISFAQEIEIEADPESGNFLLVQFAETGPLACEAGVEGVYIAPPDTDLGPGVRVCYDSALTNPVGPGFITNGGGILFTIDSSGLITSSGTIAC